MRSLLCLLPGLFALMLTAAPAQQPGDAVLTFASGGTSHLIAVSPSGSLTTFLSRPSTSLPDGLTSAALNNGALFVENRSGKLRLLEVQGAGGVTTVGPLPSTITRVPTLLVDAGGDILLLSASGNDRGVYRTSPRSVSLSTVAHNTLNASFVAPFAMDHDLRTGDLIVLDLGRKLHRISPKGKVTTVGFSLPMSPSIAANGNAHIDFASGLIYFTYTNYLMTVDPRTGAVTTMAGPTPAGNTYFYGIDGDAYGGGGFFVTAYRTTPTRTYLLLRFDTVTRKFGVVAKLPTGTLGDVVSWRSRMVLGLSRPSRGQPYPVLLTIPPEAGRSYLAGAAFGTLPGIPLGGGRRVPLNPDPLFVLSQTVPAVFSGFQGTLNASGVAAMTVNIPASSALVGLRFFLAAVTYNSGGIRVITEPLGVVIE